MKRHLREGIKAAGLRMSDVSIKKSRHYRIRLANGKTVICASTPGNEWATVRNLTAALQRAKNS